MNDLFARTGTASGAIAQYSFVKFGAGDGVYQQCGAGDPIDGICITPRGCNDGDRIDVGKLGFYDVIAGGAITRGNWLMSDANGHAVAAAPHTHTENTAVAYVQNAVTGPALPVHVAGKAQVSAVAGDIFQFFMACVRV